MYNIITRLREEGTRKMKFTLKEMNLIRQAVDLWKEDTEKHMNESSFDGWKEQFKNLEALLNKIDNAEF